MVKPTRISSWFMLLVVLLMPLAACTGGGDPGANDAEKVDADNERVADADGAVVGSFVGEVSGTDAFVAVVAAPAQDGEDSADVQIYLSDGRGLSEWFSGAVSDNSFVVKSDDGDAQAEGELNVDSVTGTVVLPGGKTVRYEATPPSGAAGFYDLTVSSVGELSGASAAGLGMRGQITLGKRGTGRLRLVDGRRLELALTRNRSDDLAPLRAGQVRLIVLSDGELRGEVKGRRTNGGPLEFFIRST